MGTKASPEFVYQCEMELALTYAFRNPGLAMECAWHAYDAAMEMHRPDLAYNANELIGACGMGHPSLVVVEVR